MRAERLGKPQLPARPTRSTVALGQPTDLTGASTSDHDRVSRFKIGSFTYELVTYVAAGLSVAPTGISPFCRYRHSEIAKRLAQPDDAHPSHALACIREPLPIPLAQRTVRLIPQPAPRQLD